MLSIPVGQTCPHVRKCPHSDNCYGARSDRTNVFNCSCCNDGVIESNVFRNPSDKTGNMKILNEG